MTFVSSFVHATPSAERLWHELEAAELTELIFAQKDRRHERELGGGDSLCLRAVLRAGEVDEHLLLVGVHNNAERAFVRAILCEYGISCMELLSHDIQPSSLSISICEVSIVALLRKRLNESWRDGR